jgi:hypothetical protein
VSWSNYTKRVKSASEIAIERRRELGKKFPSSISELQAIIAASRRVRVQRIPEGQSAFSEPPPVEEPSKRVAVKKDHSLSGQKKIAKRIAPNKTGPAT